MYYVKSFCLHFLSPINVSLGGTFSLHHHHLHLYLQAYLQFSHSPSVPLFISGPVCSITIYPSCLPAYLLFFTALCVSVCVSLQDKDNKLIPVIYRCETTTATTNNNDFLCSYFFLFLLSFFLICCSCALLSGLRPPVCQFSSLHVCSTLISITSV